LDIPVFDWWRHVLNEELQHLWDLRELDERLVGVQKALAAFPQQRKAFDERLQAERVRIDKVKARLVELQKARHEREQLIQAATDEENKFRNQLNLVKKNEEYTALLHEIEGVKAKRSDLETEVLMHLEEEEQAEKERPAAEKALADGQREIEERRKEMEAEEKVEQEKQAAIEAERAAHLEKLSPPTRQRYIRVHESRQGRAVVAVLKEACGGCYRALPPQTLLEVRRGDRVMSCEGCGRLMIWPPDGA